MEVYLDLVVLLNFLVDFLLLYGTNKLSGYPGSWKRAVAAAVFGAVYAGACVLPGLYFLGNGLWRLLSLVAISTIAFGWDRSSLRRGIVFFLLSMALGGLAAGIGSQTVWALVLAAAGLWLLCLVGFGGGEMGSTYIPLIISHRGKTVRLTALVDTGNSLKDPVSGRPVLVVEDAVAWSLLSISPQELSRPLETMAGGKYPGLRLIPYNSVGRPAGLLLGIRPERVESDGKTVDVILAFAPQKIGQGRPFNALAGGRL